MRVAPTVVLTDEAREELKRIARGRSMPSRVVERARIVLMAAEGKQNKEIAAALGVMPRTAATWRTRYLRRGLVGIEKDAPRPGRLPTITEKQIREVVERTTRKKPNGRTHWSRRSMARATGLSPTTIGRIWRSHGLKPHLIKTFKVSNDPNFVEKLQDIVGLYLSPPQNALVLSCDEKSQIQALDRTQPGLPLKKGRLGTMTHDYKRNGTTTLFAALNIITGFVVGTCMERHTHKEWLKFLRLIDAETPPGQELHLIADNYGTHKHPEVQRWLKRHPRFHMHFTPTSSSWLNMVERFFRDISENAIRRGIFKNVPQLVETIDNYLAVHNLEPKPFIWTAKASDILEKVKRARAHLALNANP
jgi:transposase